MPLSPQIFLFNPIIYFLLKIVILIFFVKFGGWFWELRAIQGIQGILVELCIDMLSRVLIIWKIANQNLHIRVLKKFLVVGLFQSIQGSSGELRLMVCIANLFKG